MKEALKLALEALCVAVEPKKGKVYAREFEPIDCFAMHEQAITAIKEALAPTSTQCEVQPVQEPEYEYLIDDLSEWKQYVEVDNAPYGLREHVTKVLLAHGIKEKNK
jgi:hypothetical protein